MVQIMFGFYIYTFSLFTLTLFELFNFNTSGAKFFTWALPWTLGQILSWVEIIVILNTLRDKLYKMNLKFIKS